MIGGGDGCHGGSGTHGWGGEGRHEGLDVDFS